MTTIGRNCKTFITTDPNPMNLLLVKQAKRYPNPFKGNKIFILLIITVYNEWSR